MNIPNLYHFIWIGNSKPYFLILAIQSVLLRCKESRVFLWVDNMEDDSEGLQLLKKNNRFSVQGIDIKELTEQLSKELKPLFLEIFDIAGSKSNLVNTKPIERSQSNLLRYLILYIHGGVYLDADTLVIKDLAPLRSASTAFFGKENSVWPIVKRHNPLHRFIWAPLLEVFRFFACKLPFGYRLNSIYRFLCSSSENNAVLGFAKQHNYLLKSFEFIAGMDKSEIIKPLRLGPFLFQRVSKIYRGADYKCYPEIYFYPYGPLISQHFFKKRKKTKTVADFMVSDRTYVLHWGASTKFLKGYTRDKLLKEPETSVFTFLSNQVITEYENDSPKTLETA